MNDQSRPPDEKNERLYRCRKVAAEVGRIAVRSMLDRAAAGPPVSP